ncbi:MAG: aspartyl protease family protein [Pseudomonadota bacterium]
MRNHITGITGALSALAAPQALAQMTPEAVEALKTPIVVEREAPVTTVPLKPHMSKLAIDATLNGVTREFIFDTGSPTMISRALAAELNLEVIGSNTGRDANGRAVTTEIAVVDRLEIGGVALLSVPVLIADFSVSDPKGCFVEAGFIGSEIFPGSVWRIDTERGELSIAATLEDLAAEQGAAIVAPLNDWGYPHAPVFPYSIGEFRDNGLFDTGHSAKVVLFDKVLSNEEVQKAFVPGSLSKGRGSLGVSAGGVGEETDLLRFEIEGMRLGNTDLGRRSGTIRKAPPSLIGLGILETHSVTLDYPGNRFVLSPRKELAPKREPVGFGLMAGETGVRVMQLYDQSKAKRAGLRLGDLMTAIDDRVVSTGDVSCEVTRWLVEDRPAANAKQLTVQRGDQSVTISLDR